MQGFIDQKCLAAGPPGAHLCPEIMGFRMFSLFLALTFAVVLMTWAELSAPDRPARRAAAPAPGPTPAPEMTAVPAWPGASAPPPAPIDETEALIARLTAALAAAPEAPAEDLPRVGDFAPGDRIELELPAGVPAPRAIRFAPSPCGRDSIALFDETAELVIENTRPETLTPAIFEFRSLQAA